MSKLNLINVQSALNNINSNMATKADLQKLDIPKLEKQVNLIQASLNQIINALNTSINKKLK